MTESQDDKDDHHQDELGHASSDYVILEEALRVLLIEKGVFTAQEVETQIDGMDSRSPAVGSMIVAKAWTNPDFKAWLLRDAVEAVSSVGVDMNNQPDLVVLENTAEIHHVVVCTLCSCYPRAVLGVPPAWYKGREYRSRVVVDPRGVLEEFGTYLSDAINVRVIDQTADRRFLVLPSRPEFTDGWSADQLEALITRNSMIGTAIPLTPAQLKAEIAQQS
jgi:nitrile hydratase